MFSQVLSTKYETITGPRGSTALVSHNRIPLVEASAKLYHAKFGAETPDWQYFHQKGKIVFGKDEECPRETDSAGSRSSTSISLGHARVADAESYWFRLLDPSTGKVDWLFPVPETLTYTMEKPFFHMLTGRVRSSISISIMLDLPLTQTFVLSGVQSRLWGFLFDDDAEGTAFGEVVKQHLPTPTTGISLRPSSR
ncbi:hypothetical protein V5O48_005862 [Marasmius crinis-equi]|uniref:Uncharacterized protein n=1 Tax=Marasmius crinis-equi TaxID=585013 RepID=A0ABR3FL42_9AGAR